MFDRFRVRRAVRLARRGTISTDAVLFVFRRRKSAIKLSGLKV